MTSRLVDVLVMARLVSQWADNITEWAVPPPLNEELLALRDALASYATAHGHAADVALNQCEECRRELVAVMRPSIQSIAEKHGINATTSDREVVWLTRPPMGDHLDGEWDDE